MCATTYIKYTLLFVLLGLISSCTTAEKLQQKMVEQPSSHQYLIEPSTVIPKVNKKLYVEASSAKQVPFLTDTTVKLGSKIRPFLFYNYYEDSFLAAYDTLGTLENPRAFLIDGFKNEAERKCKFQLTEYKDSADLILTLDLRSLTCSTKYTEWSETYAIPLVFYVVAVTNWGSDLSDGYSETIVSYTLTNQNGYVYLDKVSEGKTTVPNLNSLPISIPRFKTFSAINTLLVETTGESFRENFESIISSLNLVNPNNINP